MGGSPRRTAAHCETAHGGDLPTAPGPSETPRSRRLATGQPQRGPTPTPREPRTAHTPNEAARPLRPCPRGVPPTTPVPTKRPAHYARAHGAARPLRPCPRGDPRSAPPPTGGPAYCARAHGATRPLRPDPPKQPAHCAPLPLCADSQRVTAQCVARAAADRAVGPRATGTDRSRAHCSLRACLGSCEQPPTARAQPATPEGPKQGRSPRSCAPTHRRPQRSSGAAPKNGFT